MCFRGLPATGAKIKHPFAKTKYDLGLTPAGTIRNFPATAGTRKGECRAGRPRKGAPGAGSPARSFGSNGRPSGRPEPARRSDSSEGLRPGARNAPGWSQDRFGRPAGDGPERETGRGRRGPGWGAGFGRSLIGGLGPDRCIARCDGQGRDSPGAPPGAGREGLRAHSVAGGSGIPGVRPRTDSRFGDRRGGPQGRSGCTGDPAPHRCSSQGEPRSGGPGKTGLRSGGTGPPEWPQGRFGHLPGNGPARDTGPGRQGPDGAPVSAGARSRPGPERGVARLCVRADSPGAPPGAGREGFRTHSAAGGSNSPASPRTCRMDHGSPRRDRKEPTGSRNGLISVPQEAPRGRRFTPELSRGFPYSPVRSSSGRRSASAASTGSAASERKRSMLRPARSSKPGSDR